MGTLWKVDHAARIQELLTLVGQGVDRASQMAEAVAPGWRLSPSSAYCQVCNYLGKLKRDGLVRQVAYCYTLSPPSGPMTPVRVPPETSDRWSLEMLLNWLSQFDDLLMQHKQEQVEKAKNTVRAAIEERDRLRKEVKSLR